METSQTNRKSIVPVLVAAVVAIGLATVLALEHQNRLALLDEQQALQQQLDRVTALAARNDRQPSVPATANFTQPPAGDSSADLLRLRSELSALRQLTNELENAQKENTEAHTALDHYLTNDTAPKVATADFWPKNSWNFTGYATPDDALRSTLWASYNGNVKALFDGATGHARQELEQRYDGKSPDEDSIRAMDEVNKVKSVQVLNRDFPSDDTAVLTATFDIGDQQHTAKVTLKKVGNEWKLAGMND
jgi:hypothetical protein